MEDDILERKIRFKELVLENYLRAQKLSGREGRNWSRIDEMLEELQKLYKLRKK